ncbi:MAG: PQQ-binding-like beta-propeller repeat protein [Anaerolineae bacterium]|nr:PQQ-binding-like beta-propeller repeat protein [Anaerolineae bacterium]
MSAIFRVTDKDQQGWMTATIARLGAGLLIVVIAIGWFVTQEERILIALDAKTGRVHWSGRLGRNVADDVSATGGRVSDPVVDGGCVFIDVLLKGDGDNKAFALMAFDATTGHRLWEYVYASEDEDIKGMVNTKPLATAGVVVDDFDHFTLSILDAATGDLQHTITGIKSGDRMPRTLAAVLEADHLLTLRWADQVVTGLQAHDPETGMSLWQTDWDQAREITTFFDPVTANNRTVFVVFDSSEGESTIIEAYDLVSGTLWYRLEEPCFRVLPVESGLYCNCFGRLVVYDAMTGALDWTFPPSVSQPETLLLWLGNLEANKQHVYVTMFNRDASTTIVQDEWLVALNPADGQEHWRKLIVDDSFSASAFQSPTSPRPSAGSESVFVVSGLDHQLALVALAAEDGTELWRFPVHSINNSPTYDEGRVFVSDYAPRWRNWLMWLNPAWH